MSPLRGTDEKAYDCLASHLDNPMFIVTVATEHSRAGCLVGLSTRCSIHPPRWYVGIPKQNRTYDVAAGAILAVVHALGTANFDLAKLFGEQTGDEIDKFSQGKWQPGPDGRTPVLTECQRWFAGTIADRFDRSDHLGLILAPVAAKCQCEGRVRD